MIQPISAHDMLSRMQSLQQVAAGLAAGSASVAGAAAPDFPGLLRDALRQVNGAQNAASARSEAFQLGDRSVSLEDVMIATQQASLAFQGLVAVRNKLVEAYRDISNLPV